VLAAVDAARKAGRNSVLLAGQARNVRPKAFVGIDITER
jgi:hypothetical protein